MIRKGYISFLIISALTLIAAGFAGKVNPTVFWAPAFLALIFPFLLTLNFGLFIIQLFPSNKKLALIPLAAIIISWGGVKKTVSFDLPATNKAEYSIMTWNVKNFDLYNWSNNEETRSLMFDLLEEQKPDILCLQEFYTEKKGKFQNLDDIKKLLGYKHYYFQPTYSLKNGTRQWGIVTFSKFPIKETGQIQFETGSRLNGCLYADIEISGNIFRIYNTHLQSYHFSKQDYDFLDGKSDKPAENIASGKSLFIKMKNGFKNRSKQAIQVFNHKNLYQGKSIIVGDFNDSAHSFAYQLLAKDMQDAFVKKGIGFDKTYVNRSPFFRIDFALFDEAIKINRIKTPQKDYSDHYPVMVVFTF